MPDKTSTILRAYQIAIGYGNKRIGQNINFNLAAGRILCVLGPNGSGKSTLFKSVLGLIPLLSGEVFIQQRSLALCSRRHIAQTIAYVPQATDGMFAFNVLDVVVMGRSAHIGLFSAPRAIDYALAKQCLAQLGIIHLAGRSYTQISGGEQQLVLLARALTQQPKALVLDEPTASLDFGNQIRVLDQIHRLRDQGLAIFLCTHQPEHAYRVADEILLFKKGEVIAVGHPATTLTAQALGNLYDLPIDAVYQHLRNVIT